MTARKPSLPDRILAALAEHPGSTTRELAPHLGPMRSNELNVALSTLVSRGRVRHEGERGTRRYFAVDLPKPVVADTPPKAAKPRKAKAEVQQAAQEQSQPAAAKPIEPNRLLDGFSVGTPRFRVLADDDPIELLACAIEQHLEIEGGWHRTPALAKALAEERKDVAKALHWLIERNRAMRRQVEGGEGNEYALWAPPATAKPAPIDPPATLDSGPLTDTHGAIADTPAVDTLAAGDAAAAAIRGANVVAKASRDLLRDEIRVDLLDLVNGIALDLEDLVGHACDERAGHDAIKALAGAAGMARRAHIDLLRANPARTTPGAPS